MIVAAYIGVAGDPQLDELERQLHRAWAERAQIEQRIESIEQRYSAVFLDRCEALIRSVEEQLEEGEVPGDLDHLFAEERARLSALQGDPRADAALDKMLRLITEMKNKQRLMND